MKDVKRAAFTLLEIMIVVAVIGLLAAICIPHYVKARNTAQTNACVNNLRQIDSAKTMHAIEARKQSGEAIDDPDVLNPYMKQPFDLLEEPASGEYEVNTIGENPDCTVGGPHELPGLSTPTP